MSWRYQGHKQIKEKRRKTANLQWFCVLPLNNFETALILVKGFVSNLEKQMHWSGFGDEKRFTSKHGEAGLGVLQGYSH